MLKVKGKELLLNKNLGLFGVYQYEKSFNRSLTDDLIKVIQDGSQDNFKWDLMFMIRLGYIMSGSNETMTFNTFMNTLDQDFDFTEEYIEFIEKAVDCYLPTKSPRIEQESTQEQESN